MAIGKIRAARDLGHDVVVLRLARLLDEHRLIRLVGLDQQLGGSGADGAVEVDGDIHVVAHGLPQARELFGGVFDLGLRFRCSGPARFFGDACLEGGEALLLERFHLLGRAGVGVDAHAIARWAAEQLVDGHAERLALDVPQRLSMPLRALVRIGPPR